MWKNIPKCISNCYFSCVKGYYCYDEDSSMYIPNEDRYVSQEYQRVFAEDFERDFAINSSDYEEIPMSPMPRRKSMIRFAATDQMMNMDFERPEFSSLFDFKYNFNNCDANSLLELIAGKNFITIKSKSIFKKTEAENELEMDFLTPDFSNFDEYEAKRSPLTYKEQEIERKIALKFMLWKLGKQQMLDNFNKYKSLGTIYEEPFEMDELKKIDNNYSDSVIEIDEMDQRLLRKMDLTPKYYVNRFPRSQSLPLLLTTKEESDEEEDQEQGYEMKNQNGESTNKPDAEKDMDRFPREHNFYFNPIKPILETIYEESGEEEFEDSDDNLYNNYAELIDIGKCCITDEVTTRDELDDQQNDM